MKKKIGLVIIIAVAVIVIVSINASKRNKDSEMEAIIPEDFQVEYAIVYEKVNDETKRTQYNFESIQPFIDYINNLNLNEIELFSYKDRDYSISFYNANKERIYIVLSENKLIKQHNMKVKDDKTNTYYYESYHSYFQISDDEYNLQTIDEFFQN
jgi:hypothetical protein